MNFFHHKEFLLMTYYKRISSMSKMLFLWMSHLIYDNHK